MKHALVLTAYKDTEQINSFINATPVDFGIFIHIDKKSLINLSDINKRAKVFSFKKVFWGSWEHLYVIIELLKQANLDSVHYDYFHIITGSDFYATNPYDFDKIVGLQKMNYIDIFKLPNKYWGWEQGMSIFKYKTLASYCDIRKHPYRFINRLYIKFQKLFTTTHQYDYKLYGGSVYCSLHRDFVTYLLNNTFSQQLLRNLKNHLVAEEVYFQTVIMNSPFYKDVVPLNLRYIDWKEKKTEPKTLTLDDFERIIQGNYLFARKMDSSISKDLIIALGNKIIKKNNV